MQRWRGGCGACPRPDAPRWSPISCSTATCGYPASSPDELAHAATALLRLTRHPAGWPAWRDYHAAFCDRYGTGTLVPLTDVVDPDVGLGYPAGYPGSLLPAPADPPTERDERLLALAWHAATTGTRDVTLTDEDITPIAGTNPLDAQVPPHIELAARIHAASTDALDQGEFVLTVAPARAGGTLTSRFTPTTTGSLLGGVGLTAAMVTQRLGLQPTEAFEAGTPLSRRSLGTRNSSLWMLQSSPGIQPARSWPPKCIDS